MKAESKNTCAQDLPPLRSPDEVMKLSRLGSFFPHRLSFMRSFIRRVATEGACMSVPYFRLDKDGFGEVVLSLPVGGQVFSLIAFSRVLDESERTDRVIATRWDASFCLFEGVPSAQEIGDLADEVTRQESGSYHDKVLVLSRANKSVRLFAHVVECLAAGRQPDKDMLTSTGYLMRTTAVYGNGKFGIADYDKMTRFAGLGGPFQAEMLTVFLIREFTLLLAEHCAQMRGGEGATGLAPATRRYIGVGNSTGLGMAPFLIHHPCLIHSWIIAREVALARVLNLQTASGWQLSRFSELLQRARLHVRQWVVDDEIQTARIEQLDAELKVFAQLLETQPLAVSCPFADAFSRVKTCCEETQELMISLLIELAPELVDGLADCMANPHQPRLDPGMSVGELTEVLERHYGWTQGVDLNNPASQALFWYVSEEKLEPRLGMRHTEDGAECEMPFNIPLYVDQLRRAIVKTNKAMSVAEFLIKHPDLRHIVRRVQTTDRFPYGEIRDNLVDKACRPIDLLRCKLSFFGASKFDPKSDRWTRITLYQGAPTAKDLSQPDKNGLDDWLFALHPA